MELVKKWSKGKQEKVHNGMLLDRTTYDKLINPSILSEHLKEDSKTVVDQPHHPL